MRYGECLWFHPELMSHWKWRKINSFAIETKRHRARFNHFFRYPIILNQYGLWFKFNPFSATLCLPFTLDALTLEHLIRIQAQSFRTLALSFGLYIVYNVVAVDVDFAGKCYGITMVAAIISNYHNPKLIAAFNSTIKAKYASRREKERTH